MGRPGPSSCGTPRNKLLIPACIAQLGAGPDACLRQLVVSCDDCGVRFKLADSESADYCQDCMDAAGAELELADAEQGD